MLLPVQSGEAALQFSYLCAKVEEENVRINHLIDMPLLRFTMPLTGRDRSFDGGLSAIHREFLCDVKHWSGFPD
jgi:hypothetical protein